MLKVATRKYGKNYIDAFQTITTDHIVIDGIQVRTSKNGKQYIRFPQRLSKDGQYNDVVYPASAELRTAIMGTINSDTAELDVKTAGIEAVNVSTLDNSKNGVIAIATVKVDGFYCTGILVKESKEGNAYIQMPQYKTSKKDENGNDIYQPYYRPASKEASLSLLTAIVDKINGEVQEVQETKEEPSKEDEIFEELLVDEDPFL